MAENYIDSMDTLLKYENKFRKEIEDNQIKILRQIKISKKELGNMAKNISTVYKYNKKSLGYSFPITLSVFIVWNTAYEYSGDMWSSVSKKLGISIGNMDKKLLGDIFLNTLVKHDLFQMKEGEGKKYLSPILMHTYISDHYSYDLFDYLNKIYDVVLEGDTSQEAIDNIWDDFFAGDIEFKDIKKK